MRQLTLLFAAQLVLTAAALVLIARRLRLLLWDASLDNHTFLPALRARLTAGDRPAALTLAHALLPAWPAELAHAVLQEAQDHDQAQDALDEKLSDMRDVLSRQAFAIDTFARIAPPLAFAFAIVHLGLAFRREVGLMALQRGLVESVAVSRAMLSVVTGAATSLICQVAAKLIRKQLKQLHADLDATADLLRTTPSIDSSAER